MMEREIDKQRFQNLDLSRETFGRVFKALTTRGYSKNYSIFDIYNQKLKGKVGFDTFYVAYMVFKELGLIAEQQETFFEVFERPQVKKGLNESKLYNKLLLLKNSFSQNS